MSQFDFRSIKTFEDACQKLGVDPADFFRKYELTSTGIFLQEVNDLGGQ